MGRLFFPGAHLLINHVSMHRKSVLFKDLQLALDPVLRAYGLARPHVLLDSRNCHNFDII
jgi:hypothetical protein